VSRAREYAAAAVAAVAVGGLCASQAQAVNNIVSIDVGQPKAEIATTISVRTLVDTANIRLYLKYRATGGPPCAPTPSTDPALLSLGEIYGVTMPVGDITTTRTQTFAGAGTYQVCGWLVDRSQNPDLVVATTTGTFSVASPVGAITGVAAPTTIYPGRPFVVSVSGHAEVARRLYSAWRRIGGPSCATSPPLEPSSSLPDARGIARETDVLGAFSHPIRLTLERPGRYRFCSWIVKDSGDLSPLGVNETVLNVHRSKPKIISAKVTGRRLVAKIGVSGPGQLRVILSRKGRTILVANRKPLAPRTFTLRYRRANSAPKGRYVLRAQVTIPDVTATRAQTVRRTVVLR
jgi:hypothetical protein